MSIHKLIDGEVVEIASRVSYSEDESKLDINGQQYAVPSFQQMFPPVFFDLSALTSVGPTSDDIGSLSCGIQQAGWYQLSAGLNDLESDGWENDLEISVSYRKTSHTVGEELEWLPLEQIQVKKAYLKTLFIPSEVDLKLEYQWISYGDDIGDGSVEAAIVELVKLEEEPAEEEEEEPSEEE